MQNAECLFLRLAVPMGVVLFQFFFFLPGQALGDLGIIVFRAVGSLNFVLAPLVDQFFVSSAHKITSGNMLSRRCGFYFSEDPVVVHFEHHLALHLGFQRPQLFQIFVTDDADHQIAVGEFVVDEVVQ